MRVIVCGSRKWTDREAIASRLAELPSTAIVVHGGAGGADSIAGQEAEKLGFLVEPHRAKWAEHDREGLTAVPCNCGPKSNHCPRAGHRRNEQMAELGADLCIAFWDGFSRGTADMVDRAEAHGIPLDLYCEGRPLTRRLSA